MKNVRFHLLSNKEGEKMKKLLFLLPAMAMMLAGCGAPSEDSSSTSGSSTSSSSSTTTTQSSTGGGEHSGKVIEFDFTDVNEDFYTNQYGNLEAPYINKCSDNGNVGFLKDHCKSNSDFLVSADNTAASAGNAEGGAFSGEHGCVKLGTGKKEGVLSMTFSVAISKVEITCHDWKANTGEYATGKNKVDINGQQKNAPYTASPCSKTETLTFDLEEASEDVVVTSTGDTVYQTTTPCGRIFIFDIKLTVA